MASFVDFGPADHDVRMTQGDSYVESMLMEDGEGDAIDLVGYSFASHLRRTVSGALVAAFTITVNLAESTVTRSLSPTVTRDLDGEYVHDFQWTDPSGRIRTLFAGRFEVEPEVTR